MCGSGMGHLSARSRQVTSLHNVHQCTWTTMLTVGYTLSDRSSMDYDADCTLSDRSSMDYDADCTLSDRSSMDYDADCTLSDRSSMDYDADCTLSDRSSMDYDADCRVYSVRQVINGLRC